MAEEQKNIWLYNRKKTIIPLKLRTGCIFVGLGIRSFPRWHLALSFKIVHLKERP